MRAICSSNICSFTISNLARTANFFKVMQQERKIPVRHAPTMEDKMVFEQIRSIPNKITTTKYTQFTIVTKGLAEQFQKQANVYFLTVIVFMFIGTHTNLWIGTISAWSTASILAGMVWYNMVVWY